MVLTPAARQLWLDYLAQVGPGAVPPEPVVTAGPAGGPELTDELVALYLRGRKTAGSSILEDFLAAGEPVPEVGDFWIVLSSDGEPSCILRTVRIETHAFSDVPADVALAEGEGDLSLDHWRRVHADLYSPHLEAWGVADLGEATVITEFFEIVFPRT